MSSAQSHVRQIIREALRCPHGWELRPGGKRSRLVHPSGEWVVLPTHTTDKNAPRNVARAISQVCGCTFWNRAGSGKRSRKPCQMSGFRLPERS